MNFRKYPGHLAVVSIVLLILIMLCSIKFSGNNMSRTEKVIFYSLFVIFVIFEIFRTWKFMRENPNYHDEDK